MFLTAVGATAIVPPVFSDNVEVVLDEVMGRCLIAKKAFHPGDVLFQESAFIYSTYDGKNPHENILIRSSFPRIVVDRMDEIMDDLSNLPRVQSLDTAKNFVLLIAIQKLRNIGRFDILSNFFGQMGMVATELEEKVRLFDALDGANRSECIADIKSIRQDYPKFISQDVTTEQAARLLGIVSTNQLELEELGGSGLFVSTAILQHDCSPNCSYTTNASTVYMAAIQEVLPGQRLSIDYGNNFYAPTIQRQETMFETYGFKCSCATCQGPDKKRCFKCNSCPGVFFAIGVSELNEQCTPCQLCGRVPDLAHRVACQEREAYYVMTPPNSIDSYAAACREGFLYEAHHLLFWGLEDTYMRLSGEARSCYFAAGAGDSHRLYCEALVVLQEVIKLLEWQLPAVHHEKVVYYDRLGQLGVAVGNIPLASESFNLSYQHSIRCSGANVPATLSIQHLAAHTPTSLAELMEHYKAREMEKGEGDWEDMEEEEDA